MPWLSRPQAFYRFKMIQKGSRCGLCMSFFFPGIDAFGLEVMRLVNAACHHPFFKLKQNLLALFVARAFGAERKTHWY